MTAIMPARAIAFGRVAAGDQRDDCSEDKGETAESGPRTSTREGPNTAYAIRHAMVVYSPLTGGTPASSA